MGYSGPYSLGVRCASEILATGMGIYIGEAGIANALLPGAKGQGMGFGFLGLCYGFAFCFPTVCFGHISSILNPAYCLAMVITGDLSFTDFLALSASEFLGAFLGALLVWVHWLPHFKTCPEPPSQTPDDALLRRRDALTADGTAISSYGAKGGAEVHGDSSGIAAAVKDIAYYAVNVNRHAAKRRNNRHLSRVPAAQREASNHPASAHLHVSRQQPKQQKPQQQAEQHQQQHEQPNPAIHLMQVSSDPTLTPHHGEGLPGVNHSDPSYLWSSPVPHSTLAANLLTSTHTTSSPGEFPAASTGGDPANALVHPPADLELVPRGEFADTRVSNSGQGHGVSPDGGSASSMDQNVQGTHPHSDAPGSVRTPDDAGAPPDAICVRIEDAASTGIAPFGTSPREAPVAAVADTADIPDSSSAAGTVISTVEASEESKTDMFSPRSYNNVADALSAIAFDAGQEISMSRAQRALQHKEVRRRLGHFAVPRALLLRQQTGSASRPGMLASGMGLHTSPSQLLHQQQQLQVHRSHQQASPRVRLESRLSSASEQENVVTVSSASISGGFPPHPRAGYRPPVGKPLSRGGLDSASSSCNELSSLLHRPQSLQQQQLLHAKLKQVQFKGMQEQEEQKQQKKHDEAVVARKHEEVRAQQHVSRLFEAAVMADQAVKLSIFATRPAIYAPAFNLLCEFLSTILLITGIMLIDEKANTLTAGAIRDGYTNVVAPILAGLYIFVLILGAGGPTGLACNPARDLGPRIAHWVLPIGNKGPSEFKYYGWVPVLADFIGGAVAGLVFLGIRGMNIPLK